MRNLMPRSGNMASVSSVFSSPHPLGCHKVLVHHAVVGGHMTLGKDNRNRETVVFEGGRRGHVAPLVRIQVTAQGHGKLQANAIL